MKNIQFNPTSQTVKVGHDGQVDQRGRRAPTTSRGGPLHSVDVRQGRVVRVHAQAKAGKISYVCTIHPNMKATLTVTS